MLTDLSPKFSQCPPVQHPLTFMYIYGVVQPGMCCLEQDIISSIFIGKMAFGSLFSSNFSVAQSSQSIFTAKTTQPFGMSALNLKFSIKALSKGFSWYSKYSLIVSYFFKQKAFLLFTSNPKYFEYWIIQSIF